MKATHSPPPSGLWRCQCGHSNAFCYKLCRNCNAPQAGNDDSLPDTKAPHRNVTQPRMAFIFWHTRAAHGCHRHPQDLGLSRRDHRLSGVLRLNSKVHLFQFVMVVIIISQWYHNQCGIPQKKGKQGKKDPPRQGKGGWVDVAGRPFDRERIWAQASGVHAGLPEACNTARQDQAEENRHSLPNVHRESPSYSSKGTDGTMGQKGQP